MLLQIALAPTLIFLIYVYIRDKYEKEPIRLLAIGLIFGCMTTGIVIAIGSRLKAFSPPQDTLMEILFTSFITSGGVEEAVKFLILYFLVWKNKNFNERFDGIVYAVFISLGFAGIENIMYVFNPQLGGMSTALSRAFLSVPGHGFFGVTMGYYLAIARFEPEKKNTFIVLAFIVPWLFHSIFNVILLLELDNYIVFIIPYAAYLWISGFSRMKKHLDTSPFKH